MQTPEAFEPYTQSSAIPPRSERTSLILAEALKRREKARQAVRSRIMTLRRSLRVFFVRLLDLRISQPRIDANRSTKAARRCVHNVTAT